MSNDLIREIAGLKRRVRSLEISPRLASASLENASLPSFDVYGNLKAIVGKQSDGSHTVVVVDGPTPLQPTDPVCEGGAFTVHVTWDGNLIGPFGEVDAELENYADFLTCEVHLGASEGFIPDSTTLAGQIGRQGGTTTVGSPSSGTIWVRLRVCSQAYKVGPPSPAVPVEVDELVDPALFEALDQALAENEAAVADLVNVTLPALEQSLGENEAAVAELRDVTLPALGQSLDENEAAVADLVNVTIPALGQSLDENEAAVANLRDVTIPALESDLNAASAWISTSGADLSNRLTIAETDLGTAEANLTTAQALLDAAFPTGTAFDIDAEIATQMAAAQAAAEATAAADATSKSDAARLAAIQAAATDAQTKANAAKAAAITAAEDYADGAISASAATVLAQAATTAQTKADAAKSTAIAAAATDAQTKANAAKAAAEAAAKAYADGEIDAQALATAQAAAADAQAKADAALAAAKADATTKANNAKAAAEATAKSYTDGQISTVVTSINGKNTTSYVDISETAAIPAAPSTAGRRPGDIHRVRRTPSGTIVREWTLNPSNNWVVVYFGDAILTGLDVGKLVAGTANIDTAVINKMAVGVASVIDLDVTRLRASSATIDTGVINRLWTDVVRSRKITTDMMIVGSGENLIPNGSGWAGSPGGWARGDVGWDTTDKPDDLPGAFVFTGTSTVQGTYDSYFDVTPGAEYHFEVWLKADKPNSRMFIEARDQDGNHAIDWAAHLPGENQVVSNPYLVGNHVMPTTWTRYAGVVRMKPTAQQVRIGGIYVNHSNGTERTAIQKVAGMRLRSRTDASLIVDGTIKSAKLDTAEVSAAVATVIQLNASRITSGTIDTARLNAQEIAAAVATVIQLNASRIVSGTIDTARLNAQEIAAAVATVIQLNASRIVSGTIDTARLNAQEIAAAVATVIQLNAGRIVSGTIDTARLNAQEIAAAAGQFLEITANQITAGILQATVTLSGVVQTATSGQRARMDQTGFHAYNSLNQLVFRTPSTTDGGVYLRGTVHATNSSGTSGVYLRPDSDTSNMTGGMLEFATVGTTWLNPTIVQRENQGSSSSLRITGPKRGQTNPTLASELSLVWSGLSTSSGGAAKLSSISETAINVGPNGRAVFGSTEGGTVRVVNNELGELPPWPLYTEIGAGYSTTDRPDASTPTVRIGAGRQNATYRAGGRVELDATTIDIRSNDGINLEAGGSVRSRSTRSKPATGSANLAISSTGVLTYVTSLTEHKVNITDVAYDPYAALDLHPVTYTDRAAAESLAAWVDDGADPLDPTYNDIEPILPYLGLLAEEVDQVPIPGLAARDSTGALAGVNYDRVGVALIPLIRDLHDRITTLENELAATRSTP